MNALATCCTCMQVGIRFISNNDGTDLHFVLLLISIGTTDTSDVGAGVMSNSNKGVTDWLISGVTEHEVSICSNGVIDLLGHDGRKALFCEVLHSSANAGLSCNRTSVHSDASSINRGCFGGGGIGIFCLTGGGG